MIAHFTAKARSREEHHRAIALQATQYQHALALQLSQEERRAAQATLEATRALRTRVNGGEIAYGDLHNDWQDYVFPPSKLVRDKDLNERVRTLGTIVFVATLDANATALFWISAAAIDVERWLESWLVGDEVPALTVPTQAEVLDLARTGKPFDGLDRWLDKQRGTRAPDPATVEVEGRRSRLVRARRRQWLQTVA